MALLPAPSYVKETRLAGHLPSWTVSRVTINALRRSRNFLQVNIGVAYTRLNRTADSQPEAHRREKIKPIGVER